MGELGWAHDVVVPGGVTLTIDGVSIGGATFSAGGGRVVAQDVRGAERSSLGRDSSGAARPLPPGACP